MTQAPAIIEYTFDLDASAPVSTRPLPAGGRKRWRLIESPLRGRLEHSGLPPLVSHVLENRGIASISEAQHFLGGQPVRLGDPSRLPGFASALGVLRAALRDGSLVCVYGDFDVDGISSTAILTDALRDLGGQVLPYIPNREREGYGLNSRAIESLADRGVRVLVACDCGTTSVTEIEQARGLGVEVIVVDHHLPPQSLPDATALVNPKLQTTGYDFDGYCSAAVAFRLAEALYDAEHRPFPEQRYVELAAIATVGDMVPLIGENRELVRRGLAALAQTERPGLQALLQVAGIKPKEVTAETIAFSIAPRLNATGRLADGNLALDLLLCRETGAALALAESIDALNRERQRLTLAAQEHAREIVGDTPEAPLTLVGDSAFHQGIIGLVASRLVEAFGRPAIVYQQGDSESRGSCRSIGEYDITSGLRACGDLFERFGGHRQAGGFTIRNERLEALAPRLLDHAGQALAGLDLAPTIRVDAEWPLAALRSQEIRWLGRLQPHGTGNEEAKLLSRGVTVVEARGIGQGGRHLRLKLKDGATVWPAIAFGWEGAAPAEGSRADVVFSLSADRYGPSDQGGALQLGVLDLAPSP